MRTLGLTGAERRLVTRGDSSTGSLSVIALDGVTRMCAVISVNAGREIGACRRLISVGTVTDESWLAVATISLRLPL
ncbi:oxidoreductase C-terminal domain-containing protein [Paraburkholderia terrae]|nr:oxidoreductase C-terminal domain-containing protein [Paraburkholderia terrae]